MAMDETEMERDSWVILRAIVTYLPSGARDESDRGRDRVTDAALAESTELPNGRILDALQLLEAQGLVDVQKYIGGNFDATISSMGRLALQRRLIRKDGPGSTQTTLAETEGAMEAKSRPRKVFVVHGRNESIRKDMFDFLRAIDLDPIEWSEGIGMTGVATPYVGQVLDAQLANAQATIIIMTPDDEAKLQDEFIQDNDPLYEKQLTAQARPNVLFEAGLAFGRSPDRTILVEIGQLRPFSDIWGRHTVRLDNSPERRQALATRLSDAGCPVDTSGTDWYSAGNFDLNAPIQPAMEQSLTTPRAIPASEFSLPASPFPTPVEVIDVDGKAIENLRYLLSRGTELQAVLTPDGLAESGFDQLDTWLQRWLNYREADVSRYLPGQAGYLSDDEGLNVSVEVYKYSGWNANLAARRVVFDRRLHRFREVCAHIPGIHGV